MWRDDWPSAVDDLHSSLALQPHQEHVVQMLSRAMEHMHVHPWLWAAHGGGAAGELWPFTHVPADADSLATALNLEHVSVADYANKRLRLRQTAARGDGDAEEILKPNASIDEVDMSM